MSKKINVTSMLPAAVRRNAQAIDDRTAINKLLEDRTIISTARFVLKPGTYNKVVDVKAATWRTNSRSNADAVMVVIEFEDGSLTTLGALRRIDASMKNYGPDPLPVNEAELLAEVEKRGIKVTENKEVYFSVFDQATGAAALDENDPSGTGRKTRKAMTMVWEWASDGSESNGKKK